MATAWYTPTSFSPIPVGRSSDDTAKGDDAEDDEFHEEAEEEILQSVEYVCALIDEEVKRGVELKRIVIGGFSQGCAITLLTGLYSRYGRRIAAVVGLSGYLPRGKQITRGKEGSAHTGTEGGEDGKMEVFLAHGTRDMLVPMRVFRDAKARVARTVGEEQVEAHEYQGMGHVTSGPEFRDMCTFLEKLITE